MIFNLEYDGDHITCPKCLTRYRVNWDTEYGDPLVGLHSATCLQCEEEFTFEVETSYLQERNKFIENIYVVATRPFPEKVCNEKFFLDAEEAMAYCEHLNTTISKSYHVYPAILTISKEEI